MEHKHFIANKERHIFLAHLTTKAVELRRNLQVVEETEGDSEQHVRHPQDDGHLHLEGVQEGQLVGGDVPDLENQPI